METYMELSIRASCEKYPFLNNLIDSMMQGNTAKCRVILSDLDASLIELFDYMESKYGDYIQSIEDVEKSSNGFTAYLVCGGMGEEFAPFLLKLFGKHSIWASVDCNYDNVDDLVPSAGIFMSDSLTISGIDR